MDQFVHVRTIIGIILGLSITHIVQGIVKLIAHPTKNKVYWVHLLWVAFLFLLIIHFWWWEFGLREIQHWNFLLYLFVIAYATLFYASAYLLFPNALDEYDGFKHYYYSRKNWFFGALSLTYCLDIIDTRLKGSAHLAALGNEYYVNLCIHILLCLFAMNTKNEKIHALLAIAFILYQASFIYRMYLLL
ncbi:MAG: hypothetical protein JWO58_364 [Chitinophagaceae bacterium]|nr:hypothetical protein [Chitinophagaceae bacterium]